MSVRTRWPKSGFRPAAAAALRVSEAVQTDLARLNHGVRGVAYRAVVPGLAHPTVIDTVGLLHRAFAVVTAHDSSRLNDDRGDIGRLHQTTCANPCSYCGIIAENTDNTQ